MSPRTTVLLAALAVLAGAQSRQQTPVFESSVENVRVDVIVTDGDGRFVDDLRPEDFVVREDGSAQEILAFQFVDLRASVAAETGAGPPASVPIPAIDRAADSPPRAAAEPVADSPAAAPQQTLGALIFLIDFPGLDWRNKERFVAAWAGLLDDTDALAVPRAVYLINQVGRLKELAPLTRDPAALRAAVQQVRDEPLVRRAIHEQLAGISTDDGSFGAQPSSELQGGASAPDGRIDERARSFTTLQLLTQFCNALTVRGGRTALVWVSAGLQTMEGGPFAALSAAAAERAQEGASFGVDRSRRSGNVLYRYLTPDRRIVQQQQELQRAANSANVSIYTIDPTPRHEWASLGSSAAVASAARAELLGSLTVQASLDGLRDTLRHAASETGGRSFIGPSDLDSVIPEIEADSGRFYLLTYAAPPPRGDGDYHTITVEVLREGLGVRARRGYTDAPADERAEQALAAALAVPGTVSGMPVSARLIRRWDAQGDPIVQLVAAVEEIPEQPPGVEPGGDATLEVRAVALDEEGDVVAEIDQQVVPRRSPAASPGDMEVSGTTPATSRPFVYIHEWSLAAGEHDVRVAVRDTISGRLGATRVAVEVPPSTTEWRVSDPLLLAGPVGAQPRPLARYEISADDDLALQMEVAHGDSPMLSGELFSADGVASIAQLPAIAMQRDGAGIHRGVLRLRGMGPGRYVLQVAVIDAPVGKHAIQRIEVTVQAPLPRS